MNLTQIKSFLDDFYNGTSTAEQEQALREYFANTTDLPDELRIDADIFRAMSTEHAVPANLEQRIISATTGRRRFQLKLAASAIGIAASFALIIAIGWKSTLPDSTAETPQPAVVYTHEITDPEEARTITRKVFAQINDAMPDMSKQQAIINRAKTKYEESINKINNKLNYLL